MKADLMKATFGNRPKARSDFHAEHEGGEHVGTAFVVLGRYSKRGRQRRGRRMNHAFGMCIVIVQAMNQNAVHQNRISEI